MASENLTEKALMLLGERSAKALAMVKKAILEQPTGMKAVDAAVENYLSQWNDTTRPGTLSLACEAAGGDPEEIIPLQTALLFIDITMDIHDDIIDESRVKNHKKTLYGKVGKEATLLLGDEFMVKGFSQLHRALESLPKGRSLRIIAEVERFLSEVVGAHIAEVPLKTRKWRVKPELYFQILTKKAADLEGRMKIGAIYAGGSQEVIDAMGMCGRNMGILLAAKSEFVDIFEPKELTHRINREVAPIQILYALQNRKYGRKIKQILQKESLALEDCQELIDIIDDLEELSLFNQQLKTLEKEAIQTSCRIANRRVIDELRLLLASSTEDF